MSQQIRGIIFDVDGTLADTEQVGHLPAFNDAFAGAQIPLVWDWETYRALYRFPAGIDRIRQGLLDWSGHQPDEELVSALHQAKTVAYQKRLKNGLIPLRPGVARLINEARDHGVHLAIATTSRAKSARMLVTAQLGEGAVEWFDAILGFEEGLPLKPEPDLYLRALDMMGIPAGRTIAVEDSTAGVKSARAAAIPTLVTVNSLTLNHDFTGAFAVLDHLGESGQPASIWDTTGPTSQTAVVTLSWLNRYVTQHTPT